MEIDSTFYFGPSKVLNTIAMIKVVVYGLHHFVAAVINVFQARKIYEVMNAVKTIEENVCMPT